MQITAAVLRDPDGPHSLETVELADPGPGEVLVRVEAVGHCHTDVLTRSPELPIPRPVIGGHEGAGVVEAVGPGVSTVAPGDHVVCSYASCGACGPCAAGQPYHCEQFLFLNLLGRGLDGSTPAVDAEGAPVGARWFGQSSFASHCITGVRNVVKVDPTLPLDVLAPLGCGLQTGAGTVMNVLRPAPGGSLAVWGTGAVGLAAIMAATVMGCGTIVAVDLNPARRELALELGATHAVDGASPTVADEVRAASGGGVDAALDTTSAPGVFGPAIETLRIPGTLALVGAGTGELVVPPAALAFGKAVVGVIEGNSVPQVMVPRLIRLWQQGRFPVERLVHRFRLDEIDEAEQAAAEGRVVKPVLVP